MKNPQAYYKSSILESDKYTRTYKHTYSLLRAEANQTIDGLISSCPQSLGVMCKEHVETPQHASAPAHAHAHTQIYIYIYIYIYIIIITYIEIDLIMDFRLKILFIKPALL